MPVVTAAQKAAIEKYAMQLLEDQLFQVLLNRPLPAKTAELSQALPPELGATPRLIRKVLGQSERFVLLDRRWNLALRNLTGHTVEGSLEQTLRWCGKPMTMGQLCNEMALMHNRSVEHFQGTLPKLLASRPAFFQTADEEWGLHEWLLATDPGEDEESVFLRNFFFDSDAAEAIVKRASEARIQSRESVLHAAEKVLNAMGEPVGHKLLSFMIWRARGDEFNSLDLYDEMMGDDRVVPLSGAVWALEEWMPGYRSTIAKAAKKAEDEEPAEMPGVTAGAIEVQAADLEEIHQLMQENARSYPVSDLVELVFELSPGAKVYGKALGAITKAMEGDERFRRIGSQTWGLEGIIPDRIWDLPPSLMLLEVDSSRFEDPEADAELTDEGLESGLAGMVHDPIYEDFGEEKESLAAAKDLPKDEIRHVLLYDHLKAGTLKVRKLDRKFWPGMGDAVLAYFTDDQNKKLECWVNLNDGLVFDFGKWYQQRGLGVGSVIEMKQTEQPDQYQLNAASQRDAKLTLDDSRVEHIEKLAKELSEGDLSVFDIMCRLLADHRKGLHFFTLWQEVNIVRRTTRRVVASNLSSYHCFYERPARSGIWLYDERKVTQGRKKAKKKYMKRGK